MPRATSPHSSRRARDTATTMLDHSKHCGEMATKTDKFFVAHTVNCVLCNYHTRIDWMLLNSTPVIQQNCHQPRWKFEKSFCTVGKLSCQNPNPANSELILILISLIICIESFYMVAKCCLRYSLSSDFCVAKIVWASTVPESSQYWQHHSNYQITARWFHIMQDMPCNFLYPLLQRS